MSYSSDKQERDEIREYLERFKGVTAADKLRILGDMRKFMWKCSIRNRR